MQPDVASTNVNQPSHAFAGSRHRPAPQSLTPHAHARRDTRVTPKMQSTFYFIAAQRIKRKTDRHTPYCLSHNLCSLAHDAARATTLPQCADALDLRHHELPLLLSQLLGDWQRRPHALQLRQVDRRLLTMVRWDICACHIANGE